MVDVVLTSPGVVVVGVSVTIEVVVVESSAIGSDSGGRPSVVGAEPGSWVDDELDSGGDVVDVLDAIGPSGCSGSWVVDGNEPAPVPVPGSVATVSTLPDWISTARTSGSTAGGGKATCMAIPNPKSTIKVPMPPMILAASGLGGSSSGPPSRWRR